MDKITKDDVWDGLEFSLPFVILVLFIMVLLISNLVHSDPVGASAYSNVLIGSATIVLVLTGMLTYRTNQKLVVANQEMIIEMNREHRVTYLQLQIQEFYSEILQYKDHFELGINSDSELTQSFLRNIYLAGPESRKYLLEWATLKKQIPLNGYGRSNTESTEFQNFMDTCSNLLTSLESEYQEILTELDSLTEFNSS